MRTVCIAALAVFLFAGSVVAQHPAVGMVGRGNSRGSGALIAVHPDANAALVITAHHVVDGGGEYWFQPSGSSKRFKGAQIRKHPQADVSVFLIAKTPEIDARETLCIWPGDIYNGMPVWGEGYGGMNFGRTKGQVLGRFVGTDARFSLPSIPGDSGGIVITVDKTRKPYLMGIISGSNWADRGGPTWTAAPWAGPIRQWLDTLVFTVAPTPGARGVRAECSVNPTGCVVLGRLRRALGGRRWAQPYQINPQGSCPGGVCPSPQQPFEPYIPDEPPMGGGGGDVLPDPPPGSAPPAPPQQQPNCPCPQGGEQAPNCPCDPDKLKEAIVKALKEDGPLKGEAGAQGPAGPAGPAGEQGPPGKDAEVDVEAIAKAVIAALPSTPITMVTPDGETVDMGDLALGRPFSFRLPESQSPPVDMPPGKPGSRYISHIVIVGQVDDRLQSYLTQAQETFERIIILPKDQVPPNVIVRTYPTAVAYNDVGHVASMWDGSVRVERLLVSIARGEFP